MMSSQGQTFDETLEPSRGEYSQADLLRHRFKALQVRRSVERANGHDSSEQIMNGRNTASEQFPIDDEGSEFITTLPAALETPEEITFYALQEWEGYVVEIGDEVFTCRLVDLTAGEPSETEQVDLPISDLTDEDRGRLREGRVFRWSIGYQRMCGSKRRVSQIVFRDRPKWTKRQIEEAEAKAEAVLSKIKWK